MPALYVFPYEISVKAKSLDQSVEFQRILPNFKKIRVLEWENKEELETNTSVHYKCLTGDETVSRIYEEFDSICNVFRLTPP